MAIHKISSVLVILALSTSTYFAQQPKAPAQSMRPLPPVVVAQHDRIQRFLPPATKVKIAGMVPPFRDEVVKLPPTTDFQRLAEADVRKQFPRLTSAQSDVLVFSLMKQTFDSMSEIVETESLRIQMAMDRLSKFMTTLSNLEKKVSDTDQTVVQNIK